jgi:hypothetical protein
MECKEIDVRRDGEDSGGLRIKSAFLTQTQNTEKLILDTSPDTKAESFRGLVELLSSFLFLQFSLEGVLGAVAGLGEIAVRTVLQGVGITVAELVFHGVVATLVAFVRLLRTLSAVGVIEKMIAGAFRHG